MERSLHRYAFGFSFTLLLCLSLLPGPASGRLEDEFRAFGSGSVIIEVTPAAWRKDVIAVADAVQAASIGNNQGKRLLKATVTPEEYAELKSMRGIKVYPDHELHTLLDTSVPLIGADTVHELFTNGTGVGICLLDTGVDYNHPALGGLGFPNSRITGGIDFVNNDSDPMDDNDPTYHGTHIAGILVSTDAAYTGVAPDAHVVAVKVMNQSGVGRTSDVIQAISYCAADENRLAHNIRVITMSFGGDPFPDYCDAEVPPLTDAINDAVSKGILVVGASGNQNRSGEIVIPACIQNVVAVGATDDADHLAGFSNIDPEMLDLVAPGVGITSTTAGGGFSPSTGASYAAPHVAGVASLLFSIEPGLTPGQAETIMKQSAVDVSGYRRVDALAALGTEGVPVPEFGVLALAGAAGASVLALVLLRKRR